MTTATLTAGAPQGCERDKPGTLNRPEAIEPRSHCGVEGRLPWADCGAGLPEGKTEESWCPAQPQRGPSWPSALDTSNRPRPRVRSTS